MSIFNFLNKENNQQTNPAPIQPPPPQISQQNLNQPKQDQTLPQINNQLPQPNNQIPKPQVDNLKDNKTIFKIEQPTIPNLPEANDPRTLDVRYPLIPPYAFARIRWDDKETELFYEIEEPQITEKEKQILDTLEEGIKELINLSFISVSDKQTVLIYLEKNIKVLITELSIDINMESYLKIMYYIYRDFVGLNELEPIMNDYFVEDVECNGLNSPVYVVHRKYRNIRTNLIYKDMTKIAAFVEKLAQKAGRYISYAEPLLDGSLPDGSIDYNEPVIYKENGIVKINKIGKIIDKYYENNESNKPINVNNIEVAAFNKDYKIKWKKADYVYRHKVTEDLYELKLEFGRKIRLTGCHSIFTLKSNGILSEKTENLKEGDYTILTSYIPENNIIKEINLTKELCKSRYKNKLLLSNVPEHVYEKNKKELYNYYKLNYKNSNQTYYEHKNKKIIPIELYTLLTEKELIDCYLSTTSSHKIPTFLEINKELMWFLGLYISEGWLYNYKSYGVCFSLNKNEHNLMEEIKRSSKKCFNSEIYIEKDKDNAVKVKVDGLILYLIMKEVLKVSEGAKTKSVPEFIFNISKELQQEFIKAWNAGDYSTTASKDLANDISYLALFNQDIAAFYKSKAKISFIKERQVKSDGAYYSNFYIRETENPYPSMIPVEIFNPLNKTHLRLRNKRVNRNRLLKILNEIRYKRFENLKLANKKFFIEWSKRGLIDDSGLTKDGEKLIKEINIVKKLINSDFAFAKIKSISRVKSTSAYVYDFSVSGDENFVAGVGGICCHNSRVNATYTTDVSSKGPTFTLRKFTKEPWSPIQLMMKGTASAEQYAYLWMAVEYENSLMIIGGTGSGKTSFINSIAFFIPPQARVVSIEDSITGNSEIIYKEKDTIKKTTISELTRKFQKNLIKLEDINILTVDEDLKVKYSKPSKFLKHRTIKDIYKVTTSTGRIVEVTKDHSLFTLAISGLKEVKPEELELENSYIAVPRTMPEGKGIFSLNLLENKEVFKEDFLIGDPVKNILNKFTRKDFKISKTRYRWWKKRNLIKIKYLSNINYEFTDEELKKLYIKSKNITKLPVIFKLDNDFFKLIGLWLGDGSYDNYNKNSVIISDNENQAVNLYKKISSKLGINVAIMHDNWSWRFNSTLLYKLMKYVLKLDGDAFTKKIPEFIYNLNNNQLKYILAGYFGADGTVKKYEVACASKSNDLINGIQTLLLRFSIISRLNKTPREDKCMELNISSYENINKFKEIGFVGKEKNIKLSSLGNNIPNHTVTDKIPICPLWLEGLNQYKKLFKNYTISSFPGKNYIKNFLELQNVDIPEESYKFLEWVVNSDILWDKVVKIEKLPKRNRYVYDISVPVTERFISQNILLHNTRELQLEHENWLPSVARAGVGLTNLVGQRYGEVSLFDLLRASFRQRPDYIIVGEVRGKEAFVLFQAFASIRGDEEIFVLYEDKPLRIKIKDLENYNIKKLKAISYNIKEKRHEILPIKGWVKHPKRNTLYKIITRTGREVTITSDHSVFTITNDKVKEIKGEELVIGSKIIIPSYIECGYNNISKINLLEYLPDLRIYAPEYVKLASNKLGYYQANALVNCKSITDYYSETEISKPNAIKAEKFLILMSKAEINYNTENLQVKFNGMSEKCNPLLEISDEFLKLLGYYISEGSLNTSRRNYKIELYNKNKAVLKDMKECIIKVSNKTPNTRIINSGWGEATELSFNHKVLYEFIKRYCKTKLQKRIPDFIFGLDKKRIGVFLSSLYCGDGHLRDKGISYYTTSRDLANDVAQLLLTFGIVASINKRNRKGRKTTDYEINLYANYKKDEFLKYVHTIGKTCEITEGVKDNNLVGDLYSDTVKSIEIINLDKSEYVYDISVPGNENFIGGFGSILLHNSGHPGMATMHAESVGTLIKRLETEPINLSGSLIETLSAVAVMSQSKIKGKEVRKLSSIDEIIEIKEGINGEVINNVFTWDPKTDTFTFNPNSKMFEKIAIHFGFTKEQVLNEFKIRCKLLKELYKRKIIGFKEVQGVVHEYYKSPEIVLKRYGLI